MKWFIVSALAVALLSVTVFKTNIYTNNVCKTFDDYYTNRDANQNCYYNPDHNLTVPDIIRRHGYPLETHHVTTADGYILTVFRIPYGRDSATKIPGKPVFLQHGLASSSSCFVVTGKKSLGFILADQGYDVWLGNFRGSTYSRGHERMTDNNSDYWNFSFHEYGVYDLFSQIDLVSNKTNQKITYIGFSMGTMSMYIYGVTYPVIAKEKIDIFINLAPSATLGEVKSVLKHFLPIWYIMGPGMQMFNNGQFFSKLFIPSHLLKYICLPYPFQMKVCQFLEMMAFGYNYEQIDPETYPVSFVQNADWSSVRTFSHLVQITVSGKFRHFDYGVDLNKQIYNLTEPPIYDLKRMQVPTYFIRADNDLVVTKENVENLYNSLPKEATPYDIYVIKDEKFNHLDFVTGKDVVPLLYDHIVDFIQSRQTI